MSHTEVFPTDDEAKEVCGVGTGPNCCILLTMSSGPNYTGWECHYYNRSPITSVIERWERGDTNAKRFGCKKLEAFDPASYGVGEHEF